MDENEEPSQTPEPLVGFDQTNGIVAGLEGDDGGAIDTDGGAIDTDAERDGTRKPLVGRPVIADLIPEEVAGPENGESSYSEEGRP